MARFVPCSTNFPNWERACDGPLACEACPCIRAHLTNFHTVGFHANETCLKGWERGSLLATHCSAKSASEADQTQNDLVLRLSEWKSDKHFTLLTHRNGKKSVDERKFFLFHLQNKIFHVAHHVNATVTNSECYPNIVTCNSVSPLDVVVLHIAPKQTGFLHWASNNNITRRPLMGWKITTNRANS